MYFIVVFLAVVLGVTICGMLAGRKWDAFEMEFPPISDAEFLALCTPETTPSVALRVRRILADSLGVEYEQIYPTSRLVRDLGAE